MNEQRKAGIGAIATKYGLILSVITFVVFLAVNLIGMTDNWISRVVVLALLVALMILAHQEYKKTHAGMISYGQALGCGTLLAGIAALVRSILMYGYVKYINTGFFVAAVRMQRAAIEARGLTSEQAQRAMAFTAPLLTPVGLAVTSLIVGMIGGFIVALIVSIFTQKSDGASYDSRPLG